MRGIILDSYTTNPGDLSWRGLEELCELGLYDWTEPGELLDRLRGIQAAFTNKVKITAKDLAKLPDLKYIGVMATGYDSVDIAAAKEKGVVVTNIPEYANYSVSQLTFALILELCYSINAHHRTIVEEKRWSAGRFNSYWLKPLQGLRGKKIGVIGMGKIGIQVGTIARAFGMEVLAYDVHQRELAGVTWKPLEDLLRESDVVTIHCPLFESTKGLINKETLSLMKNTAFFINTSRGALMVERDLADALNNGEIAGAGLDVLGQEPPPPDNPLLSAKNTVLTPHVGWDTMEARVALISETAKNFQAFLAGESRNVINP